jgi:hypothetical protein
VEISINTRCTQEGQTIDDNVPKAMVLVLEFYRCLQVVSSTICSDIGVRYISRLNFFEAKDDG